MKSVSKQREIGLFEEVFCVALLLSAFAPAFAQKPELVVQTGHFGNVTCAAFSPDGRTLVTAGSRDRNIKLWDVFSGREVTTIKVNKLVNAIAFRSDGQALLYATDDGLLTLWEIDAERVVQKMGRAVKMLGAQSELPLAAFSLDGRIAAATTVQGSEISLWDVSSGKELKTLSAPQAGDPLTAPNTDFTSLALSPDGKTLASATFSAGVIVWDVFSGALLRTIKRGESPGAGSSDPLVFSSDGKTIAFCDKNYRISFYDVGSGRRLRTLAQTVGEVRSLASSPSDGKTLAALQVTKDKSDLRETRTIRLWDWISGRELRTLKLDWDYEAENLVFNPDGKTVAVSGGKGSQGQITLFDVASGVALRDLLGRTSPVWSLALTSDKKLLASYGWGDKTKVWDASSARELLSLEMHTFSISADGKTVAGQRQGNGEIRLWNAETGKHLRSVAAPSTSVTGGSAPLLSPDGKLLCLGGRYDPIFRRLEGALKIWDAESGKELKTLADKSGPIAISPDGRTLAGVVYNQLSDSRARPFTVKFWDPSTGKEPMISAPLFSAPVDALAFAPDGQMLAIATSDIRDGYVFGKIILFRLADGALLYTLSGYEGSIRAIVFSPDGKSIIGGDISGNTIGWDVANGKRKSFYSEHMSGITALAFSPAGSWWASASEDGQIIIRDSNSDSEILRWVMIAEDDYLIVTRDGYYFATRTGTAGALAFRLGNRVFPFEQFDLKLNRPDIVLQRLGAAPELVAIYHKAYQKRLKLSGFDEEALSSELHLPEISIQNLPLIAKTKVVNFKIKASDSQYPLARLNVYVNGSPLYGLRGLNLKEQHTSTVERDASIELSPGINHVEARVVNDKGVESSERVNVMNDGPLPSRPQLYVLSVGVSKYSDVRYDLTYAAKDAANLVELLEQRAKQREEVIVINPGGKEPERREAPKSFYDVHSLKLLDRDATRDKILKGREFLQQAKVEDEVVIFFAGHGLLDDKLDYYFGTSDINFAKPAARGLSFEDIENLLNGVAARRKLILMDSCHSGEIDKDVEAETAASADVEPERIDPVKQHAFPRAEIVGSSLRVGLSNSFTLLQELFTDLRRGSGAAIISAASGVEFAYEAPEWNNGVFTFAMLEGLKSGGADRNRDGAVTVSELRDYVTEKVQQLTHGKQRPAVRRENLDYDFRVF